MSLPSLRPFAIGPSPAFDLSTSTLDEVETKPAIDRSSKRQPPRPISPAASLVDDHVLLAQEAAEEGRLRDRASHQWCGSQEQSCIDDNETTPWLNHTRWPDLFRNRPLDIIANSAGLPYPGPDRQNEDCALGTWRVRPLLSPAVAESRLPRMKSIRYRNTSQAQAPKSSAVIQP